MVMWPIAAVGCPFGIAKLLPQGPHGESEHVFALLLHDPRSYILHNLMVVQFPFSDAQNVGTQTHFDIKCFMKERENVDETRREREML